MNIQYEPYALALRDTETIRARGQVTQLVGLVIEALLQGVRMGELCYIYSQDRKSLFPCEVVGFKPRRVMMMPLCELEGIGAGCEVVASGRMVSVKVGPRLLGRVLDGLGNPIDGKGPLVYDTTYPLMNAPPNSMTRKLIDTILPTGVRVLDSFLTMGEGQRIGIFAGSGVGKSTLLGQIARQTKADLSVLCLVGERGREVREFLEYSLGEDGLARSCVVVATSDTSSLMRFKAPLVASSIAEYFRDRGNKVFLMMDSMTRFAMAMREIGLAIGEPPAQKGYTPSVFALIPKLLERAGTADVGSITAIYTILVDGGDMDEPIADCVRGVLDGHIVMLRSIAAQGIFPAIDVLQSVSRLLDVLADKDHKQARQAVFQMVADYKEVQDLLNVGAYVRGSNPAYDRAIAMWEQIKGFLKQDIRDNSPIEDTIRQLKMLGSTTSAASMFS
ncbi:MAG: FliI/YscN family ATPase [Cyanobacteria bacterium NC_groundwater_1444_Ag_S-0.65um_54_12]|nr:FliI/YscN family ATPase [Cyanobacteria bacterium NC_groundwater_1444_Ag_S-0.65um_54_12]